MPLPTLQVGDLTIRLAQTSDDFEYNLSCEEIDGVAHIKLHLQSETAQVPPNLSMEWAFTAVETLCMWTSSKGHSHRLLPNWVDHVLESRATSQAPLVCLHGIDSQNSLSFAVDDALHLVKFRAGVVEETGSYDCAVLPFAGERLAGKEFTVVLRLDTRPLPFYQILKDVSRWWEQLDGYQPLHVPDVARLPMYSTWYSYHQVLSSQEIEAECAIAKTLGCDAVIVDDGWQTMDANRGYAYTGDWKPERLTDIKDSVARIQAMGMKYILWYSVPFIGYHSENYPRFKDMALIRNDRSSCIVVDPRYPEVREFLINTYVQAVHDWNLDGFKLDFVDTFQVTEENKQKPSDACDFDCVYQAADQLMKDIADRLMAIKPDILIEFRQSYIGPKMRRYGNMFRAGDCPMDVITNRCATLDLRLLCGQSATHADMIMWHEQDSVENAALQLLNILFSVPQISVKLANIPEQQRDMLKHYLSFWRTHRDVLLDGDLKPQHPEQLYTSVQAETGDKVVVALYATQHAVLPSQRPSTHIINATAEEQIILQGLAAYKGNASVYDCCGDLLSEDALTNDDVQVFKVPRSGRLHISI